MPFTPYHWGPSGVIGLLLFRFINLGAFLVASVIVDIEPFCVMFFGLDYPLHGYLHTFLAGTIIAVILAVVYNRFKKDINSILVPFKLSQDSSFKTILLSCIIGTYSHVILDSFLYTDIKPFFPLDYNPMLGKISSNAMYATCGYLIISAGLLYTVRLLRKRK